MRWTIVGFSVLIATNAHANERRFTYTYDTLVLPKGIREVEVWTTVRPSSDDMAIDNRVEIELPVTSRLQTALYLNGSTSRSGFESGVSSEWKLQVVNPALKPIGVALYGEVGIAPSETEIEGKLLVDHQGDKLIVALNVVGEHEWEVDEVVARELALETDLGVAIRPTRHVSVGLEVRNHNEFPAGYGFEHAAVFAGPTVAVATPDFWAAASVLPQLMAYMRHPDGSAMWGREMDEHEALEARLLVGTSF
jgi:hypothetical protein